MKLRRLSLRSQVQTQKLHLHGRRFAPQHPKPGPPKPQKQSQQHRRRTQHARQDRNILQQRKRLCRHHLERRMHILVERHLAQVNPGQHLLRRIAREATRGQHQQCSLLPQSRAPAPQRRHPALHHLRLILRNRRCRIQQQRQRLLAALVVILRRHRLWFFVPSHRRRRQQATLSRIAHRPQRIPQTPRHQPLRRHQRRQKRGLRRVPKGLRHRLHQRLQSVRICLRRSARKVRQRHRLAHHQQHRPSPIRSSAHRLIRLQPFPHRQPSQRLPGQCRPSLLRQRERAIRSRPVSKLESLHIPPAPLPRILSPLRLLFPTLRQRLRTQIRQRITRCRTHRLRPCPLPKPRRQQRHARLRKHNRRLPQRTCSSPHRKPRRQHRQRHTPPCPQTHTGLRPHQPPNRQPPLLPFRLLHSSRPRLAAIDPLGIPRNPLIQALR